MKNWTLRQRILASFAVIIAIRLLMVVVSYSRLLKIEVGEASVREDALPGLYYSSVIRNAWVDIICASSRSMNSSPRPGSLGA